MNILNGEITEIKQVDSFISITVQVKKHRFTSLVLSSNSDDYTLGSPIKIVFKETEVMIATKESKVSARNSFVSKISHIESGELLSIITFDFDGDKIQSVITKDSVMAMDCKAGDLFMWFIKSTEVSLVKGGKYY